MSAVLAALRALRAAVTVLAAVTSVFWAWAGPQGAWTVLWLAAMGVTIIAAGLAIAAVPRKGEPMTTDPDTPAGGTGWRPPMFELWQQADGDGERYRELLREWGYILKPGDAGYEDAPQSLPCRWPRREGDQR